MYYCITFFCLTKWPKPVEVGVRITIRIELQNYFKEKINLTKDPTKQRSCQTRVEISLCTTKIDRIREDHFCEAKNILGSKPKLHQMLNARGNDQWTMDVEQAAPPPGFLSSNSHRLHQISI